MIFVLLEIKNIVSASLNAVLEFLSVLVVIGLTPWGLS